jgi:hypothetical protein
MTAPPARTLGPTGRYAVVGVAALGLVACADLQKGAREEFADKYTCPVERVEATPRPDLNGYEVIFGPPSLPAADIKADPARLAIWRQKQRDTEASWNSGETVFEMRGCGHDVLYACRRAATHTMASTGVSCSEGRSPPQPARK